MLQSLALLACIVAVPRVSLAQASPASSWTERLQLRGDFRPQYDLTSQDQGAGKESFDLRTRLRVRLRLELEARLNERLKVGLRLASNEGSNPISQNVALGRAFATKTMALDLAYVDWAPTAAVRLTAGKFPNPLYRAVGGARSQLLWDDDLSPEGLAQTVTPVNRRDGAVRRLAIHLQQWSLQEFAGETDSWMLGGQAVLDLAPRRGTSLTLAGGYYGFANVGRLARAVNTNSLLSVTNGVVLKDGTLVPGGVLLTVDPAKPVDRFAADFGLVHGAMTVGLEKAIGRTDLQLAGESVINLKADDERLAYQLVAGATGFLPRTMLSLAYVHLERDALLSMFSYSDLGRGGTNQRGWILTVQYRAASPVTFALKEHYVRPIVAVQPNTPTHRLQLEANIAF